MIPLNKRLRVIVPTLQVILLVSAGIWHGILTKYEFHRHPELITGYGVAPIDILGKMNFPLLVLWLPVVYPITYGLSTSYLNLPAGAPLVAIVGVFDLAVLVSVALFWYGVIAEAEMRRHGSSLIRSSMRIVEVLKATVLAVTGVGAVAYACWDGHRLLLLGRSNPSAFYWSSVVDAIIGEPLLVIWAVVLIMTSVQDLMVAFRKSENKISEGRWHI
jgi:hypothetical protein